MDTVNFCRHFVYTGLACLPRLSEICKITFWMRVSSSDSDDGTNGKGD